MLVLTRKLMESFYIGDDICVTIVRLEGGQVRLGIEAPREVTILRGELVAPGQARATASARQAQHAAPRPPEPRPVTERIAARETGIQRHGRSR